MKPLDEGVFSSTPPTRPSGPATTLFTLFVCSTVNWSKSVRTPALHSVQTKVSEQQSAADGTVLSEKTV